MKRRELLIAIGAASLGSLTGCAIDPITGKQGLMLVSEADEVNTDKSQSPHQFSADLGLWGSNSLYRYMNDVGLAIAKSSVRPHMPYSFSVLGANYVNAYTFPGGTVGITRGILLEMQNEAQLAALLGHEIGHVNARHSPERMTKTMIAGVAQAGLGAVIGDMQYGDLMMAASGMGAGALLAKYSRDNEREADQLGMKFMVAAKHNPQGMTGLMQMLLSLNAQEPNLIQQMFSSHPLSSERLSNAQNDMAQYGSAQGLSLQQSRYMDMTKEVRAIEKVIKACQAGEKELTQKQFANADLYFAKALSQKGDDYPALVLAGKAKLLQEKHDAALGLLSKARQVNANEAQAIHLNGVALMGKKQFTQAYNEFDLYEQKLPGNPGTIFLKGFAQEGQDNKPLAAQEYQRFLKQVQQGEQAQHAQSKLIEWGFVTQP